MAAIRDKTNTVFRDFETIGMPNTGDHEVEKIGVRELGALIEDSIYAVSSNTFPRAPVAAATTANITLSGNQTIDGVVNPATVLVKNQSAATANGPYNTSAGAWTRRVDGDTADELEGSSYLVLGGTVNGGATFKIVETDITLGVTNITVTQIGIANPSLAAEVTSLDTRLDAVEAGKANDADVVKLTGNQSVGGVKTFDSLKIISGVGRLGIISTESLAADANLVITIGGNRGFTLSANFTIAGGFTTVLNSTGATNITLPTTGTVATVGGTETLVGKTLTSPVINTGDINTPDIDGGTADGLTSFGIRSTGAAFDVRFASAEALTASRIINWVLNDANRTINLAGSLVTGGNFTTSGAFSTTLTVTGATNVTLPTSGTLATTAAVALKADDSAVVKLTGNQTVAGVKTFSSAPLVPDASWTISDTSGLQASLDAKAIDAAVVKLTTNQTVAGIKTFSSAPVVPDGSWTIAKTTGLQTALDDRAGDNEVVKLTGNQTIAGVKTFTDAPVLPNGSLTIAKTSGLQAALDAKQAQDADLDAIAAIIAANNDVIQRKSGSWINRTPVQFKADMALVKADVGLSNVDNTTDINKPVSNATQAALGLKADDADLISLATTTVQTQARGGDAPQRWTPTLTGATSAALAPVGTVATNANGSIRRITGAGVSGMHERVAVEAGRKYRVRGGFRRQTNPTDPEGDTVRFGIQWLTNSKASNGQLTDVSLDYDAAVADGRIISDIVVGVDDAVDGVDFEWPASTVYMVPFIQTYGSDGVTDIEFLSWEDVTETAASSDSAAEVAADLAAYEASNDAAVALKANDADVVKLTGNQTVAGVKTFAAPIINAGQVHDLTWLGIASSVSTSFELRLTNIGTMTADRVGILDFGDANRGITLRGNVSLSNHLSTVGDDPVTFNTTGTTSVTLPESGTLATLSDIATISARPYFYAAPYGVGRWDLRLKDDENHLLIGFDLSEGEMIIGDTIIGGAQASTALVNYDSGGAPAVLSSGDIIMTTEDGAATIDGAPWVFSAAAPGNRGVKYAWDKPLIGSTSRGQSDGIHFVPDGEKLSLHDNGLSQSEGTGSTAIPPLPAFAEEYAPTWLRMYDVGSTSDIRVGRTTSTTTEAVLDPNTIVGTRALISRAGAASTGYGQTPLESMMRADHDWVLNNFGFHQRHVGAAWGHGGFPYSDADLAKCLKKGSVAYQNMIDGTTKQVALDRAAGFKPVCPGINLIHGTSNYTVGGYEAILTAWQGDLDVDLRAVYGQTARIPAYLVQMSSFATGADDVPRSQLKVCRDDAIANPNDPKFIFACPSYMLNFAADFVHWTADDEALIGEYIHMARRDTFYGKTRFKHLDIVSAVQSGSNIDLTFANNVGNMAVDTTRVTERTGTKAGIIFRSSGGDVIPDTVVPQSANVIRCTFASPPAGTSKVIRYAMEGHVGARTLATMPRGCLRDSNPATAQYDNTKRLYGFPPHFEIAVT